MRLGAYLGTVEVSELEPLVGWRVWRKLDGRLLSLCSSYVWQRENHSERGFYAFNSPERLRRAFKKSGRHAFGAVALWGNVEVYEHGYVAPDAWVLKEERYEELGKDYLTIMPEEESREVLREELDGMVERIAELVG